MQAWLAETDEEQLFTQLAVAKARSGKNGKNH
jgi:hypothetical protein